jgi:hypothetical protein
MIKQSLKWIRRILVHAAGVNSIEDHFYLPWLLSARSKVVDTEANYGRFSQAIDKRHGCEVIAIKPEKSNLSHKVSDSRIRLKCLALTGKPGQAELIGFISGVMRGDRLRTIGMERAKRGI